MLPRIARDCPRQKLAGAALIAAVLLAAALAGYVRRTLSGLGRAGPSHAAATHPEPARSDGAADSAASDLNDDDLAVDARERLSSAFGSGEFGLFAMKAGRPVRVDGGLEPLEWSDSLETRPLDPSRLALAARPTVRCLWDADTLWIGIDAQGLDSPTPGNPPVSYCRVVLAASEPDVRYRFCVDASARRTAHRLTVNAADDIPGNAWFAAMQCSGRGLSAELSISRQALQCERLAEGQTLPLIVQIGDGPADSVDSPTPSAYGLLDSLRGFRLRLVLLDQAEGRASPARFVNGLLDSQGRAVQWDADRLIARFGDALEWRLTSNAVAAISAASTSLTVETIETPSADRLRRYRASIRPRNSGLHEVFVNSSASIPLWVASDPAKAFRRHVLQQRAEIEKTVTDPWTRSVLLAHVARAFEAAETPSEVAWPWVGSLAALHGAIDAVRCGEPPGLPAGTSKLMFTGGGRTAEFTIDVPPHYDPQLKWPVYWGQPGLPNMIGIQPTDLAGQLAEWPNLERSVRIDPQRRYLCDWCGGAYVATDMLVARPELWAAALLAVRTRWSPLIANACHVPILIWAYEPRTTPCLDALVTDTAAEWMRSQGCRVTHSVLRGYQHTPIPPEQLPEAARWLLGFSRTERPAIVRCVMKNADARTCYWAGIDCVKEPHAASELTVGIEGDRVSVRTNDNVLGYTLRLDEAPLADLAGDLTIVENDRLIGQVAVRGSGAVFERSALCSRPEGDSPIVAQVARPHPDWQWAQMAAEIVRNRAGADAFFSPRMLRASPSAAVGPIRLCDLYAWFHNDWIALAHVHCTTRRELLPKLFAAIPEAVAAGLFEPLGSSHEPVAPPTRPAESDRTVIATPADCDELNRDKAPVNPYRTAEGPACVAEYAVRCELTPVYVVESLAAFFCENPSLDLDTLLDSQPRLAKDRVESARMLDKELGL